MEPPEQDVSSVTAFEAMARANCTRELGSRLILFCLSGTARDLPCGILGFFIRLFSRQEEMGVPV